MYCNKKKININLVQSECLYCSYRCDLNGLRKGDLCDRRGSGGRDIRSCGTALLAGRVLLHSCSQKLCLSLLQQQLLLRWSQSQLMCGRGRQHRETKRKIRKTFMFKSLELPHCTIFHNVISEYSRS